MSKINAVRLVNVNYNNNAIRISDECFHFNGESTLLSLRNGGGKSVLVQMMTAPFVHKKFRNTKDRTFESYFTTNKPSFIMVEWVLDQGAGYVMTGMMVRRNQSLEDDGQTEELEMINFISEYQKPCVHDIHHLPIVEKNKKELMLKNFSVCKQLFESYKKDRSVQFFYYDMNNGSQSRQYFDKLLEYQINYKEWETIIRKVNQKESGLSELFADCKDEKGLVEKWFLESIENKLNKDKNRMKEFQVILEKYAGQYKDNQSKIKRRDIIRIFREESVRIREKAEDYQASEDRKRMQENRVACFYHELNTLCDDTKEQYREVLEQAETVQKELAQVEYEDLSYQVHNLKEQETFHVSNRDMIEMEQENLEQKAQMAERRIHLLGCAKQQKDVDEERRELELIRQKLLVLQKEEAELEPEREKLGSTLYSYYTYKQNENRTKLEENQESQRAVTGETKKLQAESEQLEEKIRENAGETGMLKGKLQNYDRIEEDFCKRYQEEFVRNILGVYEPGMLEIKQKTYEQQKEEMTRAKIQKMREKDRGQEHLRRLERNQEDIRETLSLKNMEKTRQYEIRKEYEEELEVRRKILRYLNLEETVLFDKEAIIHASERKCLEIKGIMRNLEKEEDVLQREYQRLTQGKTLEIPDALEKEISGMGIQPVYGMEWLQKNGYTEEQNLALIHQHPFLPYALILSKHDVERMKNCTGTSYTSFPIPIIYREELALKQAEKTGSVISLDGVSFYVLFNENLLNEEKLRLLVEEKEWQIRKKRESIDIRQREYSDYFKRQEMIANQKVTKELFERNAHLLKELAETIEELEQRQRKNTEESSKQKEELESLEKEIQDMKEMLRFIERRQEDFERVAADYDAYLQDLKTLEQCRKQADKLQERRGLVKNRLEQLSASLLSLRMEFDRLEQLRKEFQNRQLRYEKYAKMEEQELIHDEIAENMELRYTAITEQMSVGLRELEEREKQQAKRYEAASEQLMELCGKYRFSQNEWREVCYDRKEENHQEALLEDLQKKIEYKKMLWNDEKIAIAVVGQKIKDLMNQIFSECGQETILPKKEIRDADFAKRKSQLRYQERETMKMAKKLDERIHSYNENLTALSEYSHFPLTEHLEWEEVFSEMGEKELRDFKGILIRDYNEMVQEQRSAKERLVQVLNQIVRKEVFQEAFYKKPLESMLELTDEADQVLKQLDTTLQSYDSLMEKLEVDISLVEKEKEKIVELLEEYVREVHQNLGMIDRSSTITIREKPIKMLKIQLPEWEENENIYHIRLEDMIDEVTLKGVEIFQKNGNAQEYFGTKITTKNLYDMVIGIGNVQIRLYKIEEQREYPITWADVAKNSGGEGFLSAFVILSSLLYYMRKDETDIFADRNEGKVLVMDNPFAQTNAAHLLKPLMEMAKKTNTQLICLTGLGGESIYSRFSNIYVLNLIAASLRNGLQYLKVDHVRGSEPETMIVSQIEVMEQQELIF
ncbi:MAG: hypothetical protein ACI39W_05700 [Brotaphodocola sp.]